MKPQTGISGASFRWSLTQTVPAFTTEPTRIARPVFVVQIEAARPYSVPLASATASSSEAKGWTVKTGPKVSSETSSSVRLTLARTVGCR